MNVSHHRPNPGVQQRVPQTKDRSATSKSESTQERGPVAVIIMDGFGLAEPAADNAVHLAHTPNFDRWWKDAPHAPMAAAESEVGLPKGQMGNSEVGHLNIGAGRVVKQSLPLISDAIEDGDFFTNPVLTELFDGVKEGQALHLVGLVSQGGVHSSMDHLFGLMEMAKQRKVPQVFIHAFTDGRDTSPNTGQGFVDELQAKIDRLDYPISVATVGGRYYGMDRDNRWDRVELAYDSIVSGQGVHQARTAGEAMAKAYERGETDEFVKPTVITDDSGHPIAKMSDGDAVMVFNFRADRVRQISQALTGDQAWSGFERQDSPELSGFATMMPVDENLDAPYAFQLAELKDTLPEVLAQHGKTQFHASETEKYPHVTFFLNAQKEEPVPGETREMVPSPKVATYDLQPEMHADELTDRVVKRLQNHDDDFIIVNYPNPDMVGHTGVLDAAIEACAVTDREVGELVDAVLAKDGVALVLADHGNAEDMVKPDGSPHTAHTTNKVPFIMLGAEGYDVREGGKLADVAPTVLELMDLPIPDAMTGESVLVPITDEGQGNAPKVLTFSQA